MLICVVSLALLGCSSSDNGNESASQGQRFVDQRSDHILPGQDHAAYNSTPATSGAHFTHPHAPVAWGVHTAALPDEILVHNLEHGGIGVHYNCPDGCDGLVSQLAALVKVAVDRGLKVVMSPYPGMESRFALTAWTFLDAFDAFDEPRINGFIDTHESSANAPEFGVPQ